MSSASLSSRPLAQVQSNFTAASAQFSHLISQRMCTRKAHAVTIRNTMVPSLWSQQCRCSVKTIGRVRPRVTFCTVCQQFHLHPHPCCRRSHRSCTAIHRPSTKLSTVCFCAARSLVSAVGCRLSAVGCVQGVFNAGSAAVAAPLCAMGLSVRFRQRLVPGMAVGCGAVVDKEHVTLGTRTAVSHGC
eukprot:1603486-Rhodomonas_salina.7